MQIVVVTDGEDGRSAVASRSVPGVPMQLSGPDVLDGPREELSAHPQVVGSQRVVSGVVPVPTELLVGGSQPWGPRWTVSTFGPDSFAHMHRTPTVDYDVVTAGSITLLLDDGDVRLETGDAAILMAAHHGWRTGVEGCTLLIAMAPVQQDPEQERSDT
jgi:hypothetical protein